MPGELPSGRQLIVTAGKTAAVIGFALIAALAGGQQAARMVASDFKVQLENYPPPHEAQPKIMLIGAKAEPQPGGIFWFTGAKLETYSTNNMPEIQVEAPHCVFDSMQKVVSSEGALRVTKADGSFSLEGRGFSLKQLQQTNYHLVISNQVHTIIHYAPGRKPLKS